MHGDGQYDMLACCLNWPPTTRYLGSRCLTLSNSRTCLLANTLLRQRLLVVVFV